MQQHAEFAGRLAVHGVDLPDPLKDALATWESITKPASVVGPVADLLDAALDGSLTADTVTERVEAAALALTAQANAQNLVPQVGARLGQRFAALIQQHGDTIVEQLAEPFGRAGTVLIDAAAVVPAGVTADEVIRWGAASAEAWNVLGNAAAVLDQIAALRVEMQTVYGYGHGEAEPLRVAYFLATAHGPDMLTRANQLFAGQIAGVTQNDDDPGGRWARLARANLTLRLNKAREVSELISRAHRPIAGVA